MDSILHESHWNVLYDISNQGLTKTIFHVFLNIWWVGFGTSGHFSTQGIETPYKEKTSCPIPPTVPVHPSLSYIFTHPVIQKSRTCKGDVVGGMQLDSAHIEISNET